MKDARKIEKNAEGLNAAISDALKAWQEDPNVLSLGDKLKILVDTARQSASKIVLTVVASGEILKGNRIAEIEGFGTTTTENNFIFTEDVARNRDMDERLRPLEIDIIPPRAYVSVYTPGRAIHMKLEEVVSITSLQTK